jgi:elongation factor P
MICTVQLIENEVVAIELPQSTICTVVEADAVVRGQTAASSYKPAMLDNGVRIMVPPFIESGTRVVVNIAERAYLERAKN